LEDSLKFKPFQIPPANFFEIDVMQKKLLEEYLRKDIKFRRSYSTNYTSIFLQYLADKCRLREPLSLGVIGSTRSGKSVSATTVGAFIMHQYKKPITVNHILENEYSFLEAIKTISKDECFITDESKISVFGSGSNARQSKLQDIRNIIAVNNISLIGIRPDKFQSGIETTASYGLRSFGRSPYICKCGTKLDLEAGRIEWDKDEEKFVVIKPKICPKCDESKNFNPRMTRFMLYNLMESRGSHYIPCGMIFIPHFADILMYGERLEKEYLLKKQRWVECEQNSTSDVLQDVKLRTALGLAKDKNLQGIQKKQERFVYISQKLGSEYTTNEVKEIQIMVDLVSRGLLRKDDLKKQ
jgi:hypothetical protein